MTELALRCLFADVGVFVIQKESEHCGSLILSQQMLSR